MLFGQQIRILKGIESHILADGSLDYDEGVSQASTSSGADRAFAESDF
jgi:hypothetical protein